MTSGVTFSGSPAVQSALAGLKTNMAAFDHSAARIAAGGDITDSLVDMKLAEHGFRANLAVMQVAETVTDEALDILR